MTPLIDIIFLLLLFFMLSSTFTRFGEIPLTQAGTRGPSVNQDADLQIFFLRLTQDGLSVNGDTVAVDALAQLLVSDMDGDNAAALLSLGSGVTAQALAEALARAQSVPGLVVTVLR
jgi:biopolymer transport protein ExbD